MIRWVVGLGVAALAVLTLANRNPGGANRKAQLRNYWRLATEDQRRTAYAVAYPKRDTGGWDVNYFDVRAAEHLNTSELSL